MQYIYVLNLKSILGPILFYNTETQGQPCYALKPHMITDLILRIYLWQTQQFFFFQAQKAKDKEEDQHLLEQLDKDFTSLAQSEALLSLTQPSKMSALKALLNKSNTEESEGFPGPANRESSKQVWLCADIRSLQFFNDSL